MQIAGHFRSAVMALTSLLEFSQWPLFVLQLKNDNRRVFKMTASVILPSTLHGKENEKMGRQDLLCAILLKRFFEVHNVYFSNVKIYPYE